MKMLYIIYASASDESITAAFKEAGYRSYTKGQGMTGEEEESEPKLGTHYWPGTNNVMLMAVPDEELPRILELVRNLKATQPRAGLRAFVVPLEECV